jgi:hypothetical protein
MCARASHSGTPFSQAHLDRHCSAHPLYAGALGSKALGVKYRADHHRNRYRRQDGVFHPHCWRQGSLSRNHQDRRVTSGGGIHSPAPKDLEIASQKQNAPGHSWHGSLGACSPLPRAREKVWWAVRGRNQILDLVPRIGKHHSFSRVLAYYWGTIPSAGLLVVAPTIQSGGSGTLKGRLGIKAHARSTT